MLTVDLKQFPLETGERVLDLGCGEGRHVNAFYWLAPVDAVGVDLSLSDVKIASERATALAEQESIPAQHRVFHLVGNALHLPFADESFDKIICSEVLEHIPDYEAVLREIKRLLKPGGTLCVSVPRYWPEKICWWLSDAYHQVEGGHIRIFTTSQLKSDVTRSTGFRFIKRHWAHALHSPFWWMKCLWWDKQDSHWLIKQYHRLLVWDLLERPALTRVLEKCLNPLFGKSVVLYFKKNK